MTRNDIVNVRVTPGSWGKTLGLGSVRFANGLIIDGVKVINGQNGPFVAMPSRSEDQDGVKKWKSFCYFTEREDRDLFNQVVLDAYNEALNNKDQGKDKSVQKKDPASYKRSSVIDEEGVF
jgi:stage V sporulation protein G